MGSGFAPNCCEISFHIGIYTISPLLLMNPTESIRNIDRLQIELNEKKNNQQQQKKKRVTTTATKSFDFVFTLILVD